MSGRGNGVNRRDLNVGTETRRLKKAEFDLTNGVSGEQSLVASFQPTRPIELLQRPFRLMLVTREEFTTDATGGNTETFSLSAGVLDTTGVGFVLYDDGTLVEPDVVDYANDTFDYTDSGTGSTLHAFYLPENRGTIDIKKESPSAKGDFSMSLWEGSTTLLYPREHTEDPERFDFDSRLEAAIPTDWYLNVYVDGPWATAWDDSDAATSNGDVANNAVISFPIDQAKGQIPGLSNSVIQDIAGWG